MEKLAATKNLSHEEWLKKRKAGIGGSDAGAAGWMFSQFTSMLDILEKRLREERPEIYEQYKKTIQSRRFTVKAA